jgi:hypothetical protein
VAVRDVDSGQVLAGGRDPVNEIARLVGGHQGVDEHGVSMT